MEANARRQGPGGSARLVRGDLLFCLFLVLAVVAVYGRAFDFGFVTFDDDSYVWANPLVRDGFVPGTVARAFSYTLHNWHPLTWLSLAADAQLFGLEPGWFHLTNVFLHLASAVLLFSVLHGATRSFWPSAMAAALFALHPLNVESVAWISERKNVLSTFFWMLGLLAYLRYAERPGPVRYLGVAACLALGLMAKAAVMSFPVALLVLDFWPLRRLPLPEGGPGERRRAWARIRGLALEKLPLFCISAAAAALAMQAIARTGGAVEGVPLGLRAGQALVAAATYLGQLAWPAGLAMYYPYSRSLPGWEAAGAALLLAAITAAALAARRSRPYLLAGWVWFLATLAPMSGLAQSGNWPAHADRYAYLPQVGVFLALCFWGWESAARGRAARRMLLAGCLAVLAGLSVAAFRQVGVWEDSRTLYAHALEVTEGNWLAHAQLGIVCQAEGDLAAAERHLGEAVRLNPGYARAAYNLGVVYARTGRCGQAAGQIGRAHV